jgi:hypothetical protein
MPRLHDTLPLNNFLNYSIKNYLKEHANSELLAEVGDFIKQSTELQK